MKNKTIFLFVILSSIFIFNSFAQVQKMDRAKVGNNSTSINASAVLEVQSSTQGFLPPRMTIAQRNAISSPATGLVIYNTNVNCLEFFDGTGWFNVCTKTNSSVVGAITAINCTGATHNGTLNAGSAASGVSSVIPYTGGNGGSHNGQTVNSTGVTGLTATLSAGVFANGSGNLTYTITGTPNVFGTASFAINIGGRTCTLTRSVGCMLVTTAVVDVTNPNTGKTWMDRNLGATQVATSSTDISSYGDYYQWGRLKDGHECRNSPTTTSLSSSNVPGHGDFITTASTIGDWRNSQNNLLWQGVNGINNPCPSGYRLPTEAEFDAEISSWISNNSAGGFASPLKLTVAGYRRRADATFIEVGVSGYYWVSSVAVDSYANNLYLLSNNAFIGSSGRANGFPVRCIKQ